MNWKQQFADALHPSRAIAVEDERAFPRHAGDYRHAAVLVPITDRVDPGVILTRRPAWLRSHAGQVAFPGGKVDPEDENAIIAALREAEEEIALPRDEVDILGPADDYYSGSGYQITPVIGVVPPDLPLAANPDEVEEWFEVPLAILFDRANYARRRVEWQGQMREYYDMDWQGRRIWGVTAGIIANLSRRLLGDG
ncbi:CoA pyrophosphatase [Sphingorhabdus sp.]|jgi:8-oxo-dGTP pyrophosphatase MutT (NUDIX family)|uniref:CoA pyrophosphatase n=1 Tax=Sphingorhabdus sp. TaxID=1902408 RepID=UPI0035B145B0|nr:CoA pyrophosphatase [Sphingomonadaceae bacterium]